MRSSSRPASTTRVSFFRAILVLATSAHATTLTITPDESTCQVGETITLSVFGDSEGGVALSVFGQLLFNSGLTTYVSSSQQGLLVRSAR